MNKKILALAICIPLVLIIIAGIIAASILLPQRRVLAQSVKITNTEFANTARSTLVDVTSGEKTLQLTWEILPAETENKSVTFISNNTNFVVSARGLVTFSKAFDGATIIIKTTDGNFTDAVTIVTKSDAAQTVNYDFETNTVAAPANGENYAVDDSTLVLFQGSNYFLGNYTITSNTTDAFKIEDAVVQPKKPGAYTLSIQNGDSVKQLSLKVVEQITAIALPIELASLTGRNDITVGALNNYKFNVVAQGSNGVIAPAQLAVNYSVRLKTGESSYGAPIVATQNSNVHTIANILTITNGTIVKFANAAVNNTYKLIVESKYGEAPRKNVSFDFAINNAYNVANHEDMYLIFRNDSIANINIVSSFSVTQDAYVEVANDQTYLKTNLSAVGDAIYARKTAVTLEGNGFKIDASALPLFKPTYGNDGYPADEPHFRHSVPALFGLDATNPDETIQDNEARRYYKPELVDQIVAEIAGGSPLSTEEKTAQKEHVLALYQSALNFTFNNVTMVGHSGRGLNGTIGTDGRVVAGGTAAEYLGFSTMNGIKVKGINLTLTGCSISNFNVGIRTELAFGITLDGCEMDDMAGYQAYIRRIANITIKDSSFGQGGHAAVYIKAEDSSKLIDAYTPIAGSGIYEDTNNANATGVVCNLVGDNTFDNWMDGSDGFFAYSSSRIIPKQLKTVISELLGRTAGLGALLKYKPDAPTDLDKAEFNLGLMNDCFDVNGGVNYVKINVDKVTGKRSNFDPDAYWNAMLSAQKDDMATATAQLAKIGINDKFAMASINAKQGMNMGAAGMSYFMLGWVNA